MNAFIMGAVFSIPVIVSNIVAWCLGFRTGKKMMLQAVGERLLEDELNKYRSKK